MRLTDSIRPTFSGPGSPDPRKRWVRKKTLATGLALAAGLAVTAATGLIQANTASAATLGTVQVTVNVDDASNMSAGVDQARTLCDENFGDAVQSIRYDHYEYYDAPDNPGVPISAVQVWYCLDGL